MTTGQRHTKAYLAAGGTGIVYALDAGRVLKDYTEPFRGDIERRALERLSPHPNIVRLLESTQDGSLILERGQVLRKVLQERKANRIPLRHKIRWLKHAGHGLQHSHENGIIQADVGCGNMILTRWDHLKLIDFEGSSIDGAEAGSQYEWFSYRRSTPAVSQQTDIFAYGCAMYEIITGKPPFHELEKADNRSSLTEQRYRENQFPDVGDLPLGELMQGCWVGTFKAMSDVVRALETKYPPGVRALLKSCCTLQDGVEPVKPHNEVRQTWASFMLQKLAFRAGNVG